LLYAVEVGMSSLVAIEPVTANAVGTLGDEMAPRDGQMKVGWDSDLIAVTGDALMDITI
jgi:imidazolonepropionase-like amidohydrolase